MRNKNKPDLNESLLKDAHAHSIYNKQEILESDYCGCFDCLKKFPANEVLEWITEAEGKIDTAWCPYCHNDTVIGSSSNYPIIDPEFLKAMNDRWC